MNYITDIHQVDTAKLTILMSASLQAYNAFNDQQPTICQTNNITAPDGFEFVECWSGIDSVFNHDKTEEVYGVVFRSVNAPCTYIFAFRGTASLLDGLDDLGFEKASFKAFDKDIQIANDVKAESGFYDIYTESSAKVKSMQSQVFSLIDQYQQSANPIKELWITGHSLGSSLSTLFSLDMGLSRPDIQASNINFACPRTGNKSFIKLYEQTLQPHDTLRVQNIYDKVTCLPLESLDYEHTHWALLLAFHEKGIIDYFNLLARHSALNYQSVINCAIANPNGYCINNDLIDAINQEALISKKPNIKEVCSFF